jgi:hypothetical protein
MSAEGNIYSACAPQLLHPLLPRPLRFLFIPRTTLTVVAISASLADQDKLGAVTRRALSGLRLRPPKEQV